MALVEKIDKEHYKTLFSFFPVSHEGVIDGRGVSNDLKDSHKNSSTGICIWGNDNRPLVMNYQQIWNI